MKRRKKLVWAGIIALIIGVIYVDWVVYPFRTSHPNFSDVERVFDRMQFPDDWQEIDSSENKGIAGRECPIESPTYCYHKSKRFKVAPEFSKSEIERVAKLTGCPVVSFERIDSSQGVNYTNFRCSIEGLSVSGTLTEVSGNGWELSFHVRT